MQVQEISQKIDNITKEWEDFSAQAKADSRFAKLENSMANLEATLTRPAIPEQQEGSRASFTRYLRQGSIDMEFKAMAGDAQETGGFMLIPTVYDKIIGGIAAKSPMRQLASIETISTNVLDVLIEKESFKTGWVAETADRDETDTPKIAQKHITVHELYAQPKATQKLLDDSAINLESWLSERLRDSFVRAENESFINGDGDNKPHGILSYGNGDIQRVDVATEGELVVADILKLMNALDEDYLSNATFLMNRSTLSEIQKLEDDNGRFLWQPAISEAIAETLFGIPIVCSSNMPKFEGGKLGIALADFKSAYKIVDRAGISIMRDPFTEKPFVKFYSVKRVGADVVNYDAIKLLKV